jgi:2'-5' RNA ligase
MNQIAIDTVLLPSEEMMDQAVEINQELIENFEPKIILDKEKCLPHISLCMGVVKKTDFPQFKKILSQLKKRFDSFKLTATKIQSHKIPTGKIFSEIEVEKTKKLQLLHETVMQKFWPFLAYDKVKTEMLFSPPEVEEVSLHWIKNYDKHYHDPSLFRPHITLGHGKPNQDYNFPKKFSASRLAVCQLGNYCTCRKVLLEIEL